MKITGAGPEFKQPEFRWTISVQGSVCSMVRVSCNEFGPVADVPSPEPIPALGTSTIGIVATKKRARITNARVELRALSANFRRMCRLAQLRAGHGYPSIAASGGSSSPQTQNARHCGEAQRLLQIGQQNKLWRHLGADQALVNSALLCRRRCHAVAAAMSLPCCCPVAAMSPAKSMLPVMLQSRTT